MTANPYPLGSLEHAAWNKGRRDKRLPAMSRGLQKRLAPAWMEGHKSRVADFTHQTGECLGSELPDFPDDLKTYAERAAYQRGVADARHVAAL